MAKKSKIPDDITARDRALLSACELLDPTILDPVPEETLASKDQCEASFHAFIRQAWHVCVPREPYIDGWVLQCKAEHLQAMYERQILKLIINEPRRHGKSWVCVVLWPTWCWIKNPGEKFICGSYSEQFAYRDSTRMQRLISSRWFQERWGHRFHLTDRQKRRLANDQGGHRIAVSPKGQGIGEGGTVLIGDDLNHPQEVYTKAGREEPQDFWGDTMAGCADDPLRTLRLLIQQRLDPDDTSGWALARDIGYEHLCLPAHYNPKRYFLSRAEGIAAGIKNPVVPTSLQRERPELADPRTEEGEILFPERFSEEALKELEKEYASHAAPAQMEQDPGTASGDMIKSAHFKHFTIEECAVTRTRGNKEVEELALCVVLGRDEPGRKAPRVPFDDLTFYQVIDTALEDDDDSAYTAIGTFATARVKGINGVQSGRALLVWHVARERWPAIDQWAVLEEYKEGEAVWDPERKTFVVRGTERPWPCNLVIRAVEKKASGHQLIQHARAVGSPLRALEGPEYKGGKVQRAFTLAEMYRSGLVYHNRNGSWVGPFEDELANFPHGPYKDQVDVASYAAIMFDKDTLLLRGQEDAPSIVRMAQEEEKRERQRKVISIGGIDIPNPFGDD